MASSTLYHWLGQKAGIDASPASRDYFVSPEGLALLHRIVTAAHLVFVQAGGCGADRVGEFLELSELDRFVGASHGSQYRVMTRMTELLGAYADAERRRLGAAMAPRMIVVCEDETFHPETCLVAIDADSGLILVEQYSDRRDGATWTKALADALTGLPVTVVQVVGDEAKGLIAHARDGLGVGYGPDLFHVQRDLFKATSRPLAARLDRPLEVLEAAEAYTARWRANKADYEKGPRGPGRPMNYDRYIAAAQAAEDAPRTAYETVCNDRDDVKAAVRGLSGAYHPYDLATGALRTADMIRDAFTTAFTTIDDVAGRANLPERCRERIAKARRVLPKFVAAVAFFHGQLERALEGLALAPAVLDAVRTELLPSLYLARAAARARTAADRASITAVSQALLAKARTPGSPFMALDPAVRQHVEHVAAAQVALFVRSSACVEGRNGHLDRYHHGLHRLSKPRLKALTTIHNFYARRPDGSTAAERFFGQSPNNLFEWLLEHLDLPAQPRPRSERIRLAA
ncbi:MAG: hypothetical protein IPG72_00880 [Ardenticatenales bacterium]|nr:hypothetical protein [Ardenticatenales bacterium]